MFKLFHRFSKEISTKHDLAASEALSQTGTSKGKRPADDPSSLSPSDSFNEATKDINSIEHTMVSGKSYQTISIPSVPPVSSIGNELPSSSVAITEKETIISEDPGINNNLLLTETWSALKTYAPSEEKPSMLQKVEDAVTTVQQTGTNYQPVITATENAVQSMVTIQTLEQNIDHYLDGSRALMKALEEIGKIHPIANGDIDIKTFPVSVIRRLIRTQVIWTLEMTRRDNDKKVIAVFVEMKDMMQVLLQLQDMKDADVIAPDGTTMMGRLQKLLNTTANDIFNCAHLCDTYSKKKTVVKILKSSVWESRLLQYVDLFNKRRTEFQLALPIHTAKSVDDANSKIDALQAANAEINRKLDMLLLLFERFVTPEQKRIVEFVEKNGGLEVCAQDSKTLKELAEIESKLIAGDQSGSTTFRSITRSNSRISKRDLDDLRKDLTTSIDDSLQENITNFQQNFGSNNVPLEI